MKPVLAPSAEDQIAFLTNVQRLLSEGAFTSTYKYALLLALADIAVESGQHTGSALTISTSQIAEKFVEYYWPHAAPYAPSSTLLMQNTDRQAAVIQKLAQVRLLHGDLLHEVNARVWRG